MSELKINFSNHAKKTGIRHLKKWITFFHYYIYIIIIYLCVCKIIWNTENTSTVQHGKNTDS